MAEVEMAERPKDPTATIRFVVLIVLLTTFACLALIAHTQGWLTPQGVQAFVARGGFLSPLVYLAVTSVLIMVWFPRSLLSMVAGALFGVSLGSILALLMGTIGALGGYYLGMKLGHPYLVQRTAGRSVRFLEFIQRRGFWAVLSCRVCPLVPTELISVTSGTTGIPLRHFVAASLVGMAPGAFLYAAFGASLLDLESRWITWASLAGFALLTLITGTFLAKLWRMDRRPKTTDDPVRASDVSES